MARAGPAGAGDRGLAATADGGRQTRLVTGDHRRLNRRREKGGGKTAKTVRSKHGSRYHLAVESKRGLPLELRLSAGNENERRHLRPLLDQLARRGHSPEELRADRGYYSKDVIETLCAREIKPEISKPRRKGEPIPEGTKTWTVTRGRKQHIRVADPKGAGRWMIERTNAWLRSCPRIDVRRDVKPENYFSFLQLRSIMLLATNAI